MRGLKNFVLGNWPLKIGAVVLATVLYGGVVLSQNTRTWPGQVPIDIHNPPRNAAVVNPLGFMTDIQYRAPLEVASRLTNGSFFASIDLANVGVPTDGSSVEVPVSLNAVDASVDIVDYQPKTVNVFLDPVVSETRPVTVDRGQVPEGLTIGPPQVDPQSVTVTGGRSLVSTVQSVVARVIIDASGLNVDEDVDVVPLDDTGQIVTGVQVAPNRAHVRIDVAQDLSTAQLPVRVTLAGTPADGYEIESLSVRPLSVTVSGEAPVIARLSGVDTAPVDIGGKNADFDTQVALDVPQDVTIDGDTDVMVHVAIAPSQASRTLEVGLQLLGADPQTQYQLGQPSVLVILTGPAPTLDALSPEDLTATLDVTGLSPGSHDVAAQVIPIEGVSIGTVTPESVTVTVLPPPTPSPSPTASPTPELTPEPTPAPTPETATTPSPAPAVSPAPSSSDEPAHDAGPTPAPSAAAVFPAASGTASPPPSSSAAAAVPAAPLPTRTAVP